MCYNVPSHNNRENLYYDTVVNASEPITNTSSDRP